MLPAERPSPFLNTWQGQRHSQEAQQLLFSTKLPAFSMQDKAGSPPF